MKTAVIYARVSSSNDRQDTSRQIEDLKKYAISQDIEIVNIFQEHISGAKKIEERQILGECLEYCKRESVNCQDWEGVHYRFFALWIYCMNRKYRFTYRTWVYILCNQMGKLIQ